MSLLAAAVSALAFVAYKHPHGYRILAIPLGIVTFVGSVSAFGYRLGGLQAAIRILNDRLRAQPNDPLSAVDHLIVGTDRNLVLMGRIAIVCLVVLGYLALLWFLPLILGT